MGARVLLHVGTPKTATTALQDILFRNRDVLAAHDVHYPAAAFDDHFRAALDLLGRDWPGGGFDVTGAWDRLAETVRGLEGSVVISSEILAGATPAQAARAVESLGGDVTVVITARDLGRQIPAEFVETAKHFARKTYAEFLRMIAEREGEASAVFWPVQELPDIVERWTTAVPRERVTIVTLPPAGSGPEKLWERFVQAFDLHDLPFEFSHDRSNASVGVPEIELIRAINARVEAADPGFDYGYFIREILAHRRLATHTVEADSPRIVVPPERRAWVDGLAAAWIEALEGCQVVGNLEELRPSWTEAYVDPASIDQAAIIEAAVESILALAIEGTELRNQRDHLAAELDRLRPIAGLKNATKSKVKGLLGR